MRAHPLWLLLDILLVVVAVDIRVKLIKTVWN